MATATYVMNLGTLSGPTFNPQPGQYTASVTVALSAMAGSIIRYTTDGTTPNASSPIYAQPLSIATTTTVKTIALHPDYSTSPIATGVFTITPPVVATPELSPGSGTYTNDQTVVVTASTTGAELRYTLNGADPTESDALISGGASMQVSGTTVVKVRGFKADWLPSDVATATYTLVAASPTFTPASGTYTAAQLVVVATDTNGAVIRYTTDGSTPASESPVVSGALSISIATTLKAKAFKANYTDSAVATATYTFNFGALVPPTFDPGGGTFPCSTQVSLSSIAGAVIRYTVDGSTPTESSAVYAGPLALLATATINAIAVHPDYTTSIVASATYTIDTTACTPPTIAAGVSPSPTASGWYAAATTVSFTCTPGQYPVAFCTAPVTIGHDEVGYQVFGEAVDTIGNRATMSVTVNVDVRPPLLSIYSPQPGAVLPLDTSSIVVKGSVADSASGIAVVTCGAGVNATVSGRSYTCVVPVINGSNTIQVEASDLVGHVVARDVSVTVADLPPTAIEFTPAKMTMFPGQVRELSVTDDRGRPVPSAVWSVAQPLVAEVTVDESGTVRLWAKAPGETALTVTVGALSANATLTVIAGETLQVPGTVLWELNPSTLPMRRGDVLRAVPVTPPPPKTADLFYVEYGKQVVTTAWPPTVIRGVTLDGRQLWVATVQGHVKHVAADNYGGVVVVSGTEFYLGSETGFNSYPDDFQSIRRLDGASGAITWEYAQQGQLSEVAIRPDGTVFAGESIPGATNLVALDGSNGSPVAVSSLGFSELTINSNKQSYPANATAPIVDGDGTVVVAGYDWHRTVFCAPEPPHACVEAGLTDALRLFNVPDGGLTLTSTGVNLGSVPTATFESWALQRLVPDGHDGFLVASAGAVYRFGLESPLIGPLAVATSAEEEVQLAVGEDGAYALSQFEPQAGFIAARLVSFDPVSLGVLTVAGTQDLDGSPNLRIETMLAGGGTIVSGGNANEQYFVNSGIPAGFIAPSGGSVRQISPGLWGALTPAPMLVAGSTASLANVGWENQGSRAYQNNAVYIPTIKVFVTNVLRDSPPYVSADYKDEVQREIDRNQVTANLDFKTQDDFKYDVFMRELPNPLNDAIAVMAHSTLVTVDGVEQSVGLEFNDYTLTVFPYTARFDTALLYTKWPPLPVRPWAKVVFFGSCRLGAVFRSIFNIDENAADRTWIVPEHETDRADLLWSAMAWLKMMKELSKPNVSVFTAVNLANTYLAESGIALRFKAIGANDGRRIALRRR